MKRVNSLIDTCIFTRDTRLENSDKYYSFPSFTGLMYAILFHRDQIIDLLFDSEHEITTVDDAHIPMSISAFPLQFQQLYGGFLLVPAKSTILDLMLITGNFKLLVDLFQKCSSSLLKNLNSHKTNSLGYMIELYQILQPKDLSD